MNMRSQSCTAVIVHAVHTYVFGVWGSIASKGTDAYFSEKQNDLFILTSSLERAAEYVVHAHLFRPGS